MTSIPLVIDNGSQTIKAGLANDKIPRVLFQNLVGTPKNTKTRFVSKQLKEEISREFEFSSGGPSNITLKYPMKRGVVENFDLQEHVWRNIYDELELKTENHPVLLTVPPHLTEGYLSKLSEVWFETFNVPSLFFSLPPILSLHSMGLPTGVVLDCGDQVTQVMSIFEGFKVEDSVIRQNLAGWDVTTYFANLLRRKGAVFTTPNELEMVREAKEDRNQFMYICEDLKKETYLDERGEVVGRKKTLPDGSTIDAAGSRYKSPELLFRPSILGKESLGLPQLIVRSVKKSDMDLRTELYQSVVLTGGSTLFSGFCERMLKDIRALVPRDRKIIINAPPERKYSCWIGGMTHANSPEFRKSSTKKKDFEESGVQSFLKRSYV